jgi:hypothetical protein
LITNKISNFKRIKGLKAKNEPDMARQKLSKANEFDKKFDKGEDISKYLDLSRASRPGRDQKRVNVDLPKWMIESLDKEARRLGVTRQSIIKVWIAERLEKI